MKQLLLLVISTTLLLRIQAQLRDSATSKPPGSWDKFEPAPRIAFGVQKGFYLEGGIVFQRYQFDARHGFAAVAFYACAEWVPAKNGGRDIIGPKLGAEMVYNGGTGGIEVTYLTDSRKNDVLITPKYGFGLGLVTLFYGYNISTNKYVLDRVRRHQVSLAFNTNMLFYQAKYDRRRK